MSGGGNGGDDSVDPETNPGIDIETNSGGGSGGGSSGGSGTTVATPTGPPEDFDWSPFSTYAPSTYYEATTYTPPEGAVSYLSFDASKYLQANPDVFDDAGFRTSPEAVYSHYVGRYPDSFETNLPGYTGPRTGDYARSDEDVAAITTAAEKATALTGLDTYIDPATGKLRVDLLGGDIAEDYDLDELKATGTIEDINELLTELAERQSGRDTGYLGIWGAGGYEKFLTAIGTTAANVDDYGQTTPFGTEAAQATDPTLAEGTKLDLTKLVPDETKEFLTTSTYKVAPGEKAVTAAQATNTTAAVPAKTLAQSYVANKAIDEVTKQTVLAAKQEELSDIATAAQGTVESTSTVQGQLASLMQQFEGGKIPAFAAGALRVAEQKLAARGMGASSMAGAAVVQAAMEASTPIAAADAETYRRMSELNLNNRQAAEILNAQQTLTLDLANLTNEQQARVMNIQNRVQSLFHDQAAVNTSLQFNAQSEQQNDQFFSTLFNQAAQFNAAQTNATSQYNAGQSNVISRFNSDQAEQRDQFNTRNAIVIDQANAVYRREVNAANTALINAETDFNVRNLFSISQRAQANMLQQARDQEAFSRTVAINKQQYDYQLSIASFNSDRNLEVAAEIADSQTTSRLLTAIAGAIFG